MKKLLAIIIAAVMISACTVTAFADTTDVSYDVQPTYTVAIPASVTLGDADVTADITASDVILEEGKQVVVELTSASNTASGSTFNAKNGDSTVTYTITGDEAIAVGDTVATFTANGSKTLTFSAADKSAVTVAGAHTETLTFTVSVEDAESAIDLSTLTADCTAQDGDVLTGTLSGNKKITIADGATVTLRDVTITSLANNESVKYAGITPLGDATIILEGENFVKGGHEYYPGIYAAANATLTIKGDGSLTAFSNGYAAGIGSGWNIPCGNIVIESGTVTATGGNFGAGIGSGCGHYNASTCGKITIQNTVTSVTATKGTNAQSIGAGYKGSCGTVTIEVGANVTQN